MAKGDHSRMQNQTNYQTGLAQNNLNNLRETVVPQNQYMWNSYTGGVDRNVGDYDAIMQGYRNYLGGGDGSGGGGGGGGPVGPSKLGPLDQKYRGYVDRSLAGYENFANTGGFSPEDLSNIRARAISPTRAVYANAQRNMDRARALQGGYAPNYIAAHAKTARDLSQAISDANVNANASIAQMVQQGKLAGLGGMQQGGFGQQGIDLDIAKTNAMLAAQAAAAGRANAGASSANQLAALRGMTDLYGTNPALVDSFGRQVLGSTGQLLDVENLQQGLARNAMTGQNMVSGTPGNFQSAMGNVASGLGLVGQVGGIMTGLGGILPFGRQNPYAYTGQEAY